MGFDGLEEPPQGSFLQCFHLTPDAHEGISPSVVLALVVHIRDPSSIRMSVLRSVQTQPLLSEPGLCQAQLTVSSPRARARPEPEPEPEPDLSAVFLRGERPVPARPKQLGLLLRTPLSQIGVSKVSRESCPCAITCLHCQEEGRTVSVPEWFTSNSAKRRRYCGSTAFDLGFGDDATRISARSVW